MSERRRRQTKKNKMIRGDDGIECEIDGITGIQVNYELGTIEYNVKWVHFDDPTWEPEEKMNGRLPRQWIVLGEKLKEKFGEEMEIIRSNKSEE